MSHPNTNEEIDDQEVVVRKAAQITQATSSSKLSEKAQETLAWQQQIIQQEDEEMKQASEEANVSQPDEEMKNNSLIAKPTVSSELREIEAEQNIGSINDGQPQGQSEAVQQPSKFSE